VKVFIHGWGFDESVFKEDGLKLQLPGHGNRLGSLQEAIQVYKNMLNQYENIDIIGWSMGASLGIMLTEYLDNINSITLIGFSPHFKEAYDKITFLAFIRTMKKDFYRGLEEFRKNAYPFEFRKDYPDKDIALKILEEYIELDLKDVVKNLKIPTKLIHGEEDKIVPIKEAYKTKELNKNIDLITYKGGHFPSTETIIYGL